METQYTELLKASACLSPSSAAELSASMNLSRASPFGSFSQMSSRRTYAYLIATLNASQPDYDFSNCLRPTDFRRAKNMWRMMNTFDSMLNRLHPRYSSSFEEEYLHRPDDMFRTAIPQTEYGDEPWNPRMWRLIDQEINLKECSFYSHEPEDDPYEGEDGALWRLNYFIFNKAKKRVCHLYLKGISILDSTPPPRTPTKPKRPASGTWSFLDAESCKKRAKYWLGDRADDGGDEEGNQAEAEVLGQGAKPQQTSMDPQYISSGTDSGSESPCEGRGHSASSGVGSESPVQQAAPKGSPVRGFSEEIAATMDP